MSKVYELFEGAFHVNEKTNCYLWDGDLTRSGEPMAEFLGSRVKVRDMIVREGGNIPAEWDIRMLCENPRCINLSHMEVIKKAKETPAAEVAYSEDELETVRTLTNEGYRQEIIAERLNTSRSRVAKMVRILKDRLEKALNVEGTE